MIKVLRFSILTVVNNGTDDIKIWGPIILFSMLIAAIVVKYRLYINVISLVFKSLTTLRNKIRERKNQNP